MPCRLCRHRDSCSVYEKIRALEDGLRDSLVFSDYALFLTILSGLEDDIAEKCRNYEEVKE